MTALQNYIKRRNLTQEELKKILHYDPETGIFTWKTNKLGTAGSINSHGYIVININKIYYKAHRLAYLYIVGSWPRRQIDHRNRIRSDNRWENLREATNGQNTQNASLRRNNTSGIRGVSFHKNTGKWLAKVMIEGKLKHLGYFVNIEEAKEAYDKAAREAFGPFYNDGAT